MNIAFLSQVYRPTINGVVISMDNFARGLRELGHTVNIVAMKPTEPCKDDEFTYRWKYSLKARGKDYGAPWPFSRNIREVFKRSEIIHVQHPFAEGIIGNVQKRLRGKKIVFTYHTMYDKYSESYFKRIGKANIVKKLVLGWVHRFCNQCDLVIAPSKGVRDFLKGKIKTRIEVVPTGIDVDRFRKADGSDLIEKYGIEGPLIVYTGRIAKEKNIDMLLEAHKNISEDVTLLLVGGADKKFKKKISSMPGVILTGNIPYSEMPDYYKIPGTLFFISASDSETQGITYLEAMASGLPVIAMRCWGSEDIIVDGENGYIVDSLDDLIEKRDLLLENEALRKQMSKAASRSADEHSIVKEAEKMLRAYQSILPSS